MYFIRNVKLDKKLELRCALQCIYGVGGFKAFKLCAFLGLSFPYSTSLLNRYIFVILSELVLSHVWLKVRLMRVIYFNISKLVEMDSYKGKRHFDNLPCRGQRTRTNASVCKKLKLYRKVC